MKNFIVFAILSMCFAVSASAQTQWYSDSVTNTPVCIINGDQTAPVACSDGADGIIVAWADARSGSSSDIYAQRLDKNGNRLWGPSGVPICVTSADQKNPIIAQDGNHGAYIVWEDARKSTNGIDLFAQHVAADGTIKYPLNGKNISDTTQDQNTASIAWDENNSAWVVWEDNRNKTTSSRPDIYMNLLNDTTVFFGTRGRIVCNSGGKQSNPRVASDGSGGCYVAWTDGHYIQPNAISMLRFSSTGSYYWNDSIGVKMYQGDNLNKNSSNIVLARDGNQCMMAWEEASPTTSNGQNILANRIKSDSTKVWFSPAEVTGDYFGDQTNPAVFSDDSVISGNAGLMVMFQDFIGLQNGNDVAMVRVFADGVNRAPTYVNGFYYLCSYPYGQTNAKFVKAGNGHVIGAWEDARLNTGDSAIYAQHVERTLKRYYPTPGAIFPTGKPLSSKSGRSAKHVTLVPVTNGAIAVWSDNRNSPTGYDIYAQLVFTDGSLPIELSSFDVKPVAGSVLIDWTTASEKDNAGFMIQRRWINQANDDNHWDLVESYETNGALAGSSFSSGPRHYYCDDRPMPGIYEYRLIDVSLDGMRTPHSPKLIDLTNSTTPVWSVGVSHPNPFTDNAFVPVSLASKAVVDITVTDELGRQVASLASHELFGAGEHQLSLRLGRENAAGIYYVSMYAYDPSTGSLIYRSEKPAAIQLMR